MQNLSLQLSQAVSPKKIESHTGVNPASSVEKISPFQMMLSKQVKTGSQAEAQQTKKMKTSNTQTPNASQNSGTAKPTGNVSKTSTEQVKPKSKAGATEKNAVDDTLPENINLNLVEAGQIDLTALAATPVANASVQLDTQGISATLLVNVSMQVNTQPASALPENKIVDSQVDDSHTDKNRSVEMMPTSMTNKPSSAEGAAKANVALEDVKEFKLNELTTKEIAMPTSVQAPAQPNANLPAQQVASANYIQASPGKAGWDQAISQKIVWMVGAEQQSATLTLNPPDLGPLQVVIHVHNDQADTTFISDDAEVRQALQDGMNNLRDKMSESGIQLGQANVNSGRQAQQQLQQSMQNRQSSPMALANTTLGLEETTQVSTLARVSNGLVDTFA